MAIEFLNATVVINSSTATEIQLTLKKTGTSVKQVSANVILSGADVFFPAAQQYNGIKKQVVWEPGQQGNKVITIPLEPTSNSEEYLLATLDDVTNDTIGAISRAYILISKTATTGNKFLPTEAGSYLSTVVIGSDGKPAFGYKNESELAIADFVPPTATQPGQSGTVPAPPAGTEQKILTQQGWASTKDAIAPFTPNTPSQPGSVGGVPAPPSGSGTQVLTNNGWTGSENLPDFTPNTTTAPGKSGDVPAPPAGAGVQVLTNNGWIVSENLPDFSANTATAAGKSGDVPAPPAGTGTQVLTNTGWSSSQNLDLPDFTPNTNTNPGTSGDVPAPPAGPGVKVLTNSGWTGAENLPHFTENTTTTAGTAGIVPPPPASLEPMILTARGWDGNPSVATPLLDDFDKSVVNSEWVQRRLQQFKEELQAELKDDPGTVKMWASPRLLEGYLWCHGQEVSRTEYADLFAEIGTTWGAGNGSTTFNVPNSQDLFIRGAGGEFGLGAIAGSNSVALNGDHVGPHVHGVVPHSHVANFYSQEHTHFASTGDHTHNGTAAEHTHSGRVDPHNHGIPAWYEGGDRVPDGWGGFDETGSDETYPITTTPASPGVTIDPVGINFTLQPAAVGVAIQPSYVPGTVGIDATGLVTESSGNGVPFDIKPRFAAFNFIIKY